MKYKKQQSGFTLIETLVAVLILTISIGGLLTLAAGGFYSVRYARNQIVANNLLQESLEYIRNSRDSAVINGLTFEDWKSTLGVDIEGNPTDNSSGCFSDSGCFVDQNAIIPPIRQCQDNRCPYVYYYPDNQFYGYGDSRYPFSITTSPYQTSFVRTIKVAKLQRNPNPDDQLIINGEITWLNGSVEKTLSQSILLTNWSTK